MARIRVGVSTLTEAKLIAKCYHVQACLAANVATFPAPPYSLFEMEVVRKKAEARIAEATDGGRWKTFYKNEALEEVRRMLTRTANYVEFVSQGNVDLFALGGFEIHGGHAPLGPLENPTGLRVLHTGHPGVVKLRWKPRHGSRSYQVYITEGNPNDPHCEWKRLTSTTRASCIVGDLTVARVVGFAVSAIGAAGETGRSQPASLMVA